MERISADPVKNVSPRVEHTATYLTPSGTWEYSLSRNAAVFSRDETSVHVKADTSYLNGILSARIYALQGATWTYFTDPDAAWSGFDDSFIVEFGKNPNGFLNYRAQRFDRPAGGNFAARAWATRDILEEDPEAGIFRYRIPGSSVPSDLRYTVSVSINDGLLASVEYDNGGGLRESFKFEYREGRTLRFLPDRIHFSGVPGRAGRDLQTGLLDTAPADDLFTTDFHFLDMLPEGVRVVEGASSGSEGRVSIRGEKHRVGVGPEEFHSAFDHYFAGMRNRIYFAYSQAVAGP